MDITTITISKKDYDELKQAYQMLKDQNLALQNSLVYFKSQNEKLIIKIEDLVNIQKTVKDLSKKVLQYTKLKIQFQRMNKSRSAQQQKIKTLQEQLKSLSLSSTREKEYQALNQSRQKFEAKSKEVIKNLKTHIAKQEAQYKALDEKCKKIKKENQDLSDQNQEIRSKYQQILQEVIQYKSRSFIT